LHPVFAHLADFSSTIEYWKLEPASIASVVPGPYVPRVLAEAGRQYVVYFPHGGPAALALPPGRYRSRWFNLRSGEWIGIPSVTVPNGGQK
jgi:hypothetical protein